jgi:hypothetical protein
MSDQKFKDMGNLSRASGEIRKKLELSFTPQPAQEPISQVAEINNSVTTEVNKTANTDFGKTINTEIPISGKAEFKPTAINTESHIDQMAQAQGDQATVLKIGSRYKKVVPRATDSLKSKATFCLDMVAVEQLNLIYIKRLSTHQKSDRSSLICEAISLLFEKESLGVGAKQQLPLIKTK